MTRCSWDASPSWRRIKISGKPWTSNRFIERRHGNLIERQWRIPRLKREEAWLLAWPHQLPRSAPGARLDLRNGWMKKLWDTTFPLQSSEILAAEVPTTLTDLWADRGNSLENIERPFKPKWTPKGFSELSSCSKTWLWAPTLQNSASCPKWLQLLLSAEPRENWAGHIYMPKMGPTTTVWELRSIWTTCPQTRQFLLRLPAWLLPQWENHSIPRIDLPEWFVGSIGAVPPSQIRNGETR